MLADRDLLLQVDDALAQRKQQFLFDKGATRGLEAGRGSLFGEAAVDHAAEVDLALELDEDVAQRLLVVGEGEVVAAQHVGAGLEVADDAVERVLGLFVFVEVALQRLAHAGDEGQRARHALATEAVSGGVEILHLAAQLEQRLGHRPAFIALVRELADRRLQHSAAPCRLALQLDAHLVDRLALALEFGAFDGKRIAHEGVGHCRQLGVFRRLVGWGGVSSRAICSIGGSESVEGLPLDFGSSVIRGVFSRNQLLRP